MFKFTKTFAAMALAFSSVAVSAQSLQSLQSAQDPNDRSDMFNQDATNVPTTSNSGDVSAVTLPRRLTITNSQIAGQSGASAVPADAQGRALAGAQAGQAAQAAQSLQAGAPGLGVEVKKPSEFQKFLWDNLGKDLPIFGSDFFVNTPSTFAPVTNAPVSSEYVLGPGDELLIRGWGTIDIDYRAVVNRNGAINIPTIGMISLAGLQAGDAEKAVRNAIGRLYKGVNVSVTFGQLRSITVYVVGQARRPGTYTVSSLSTLVTALFASGGPNANGSMRHVQVKRGGKVAAELDLYSFIAKGDKSADIKLQDGDTIFIPPSGGSVALVGKVNTPSIFELKSGNDTIESMLDIAGGLPVVADPRRAFLERIDPNRNHPRTVDEFALNADGLKRPLKNGDVLNVTSITPDFANAVMLRGNVDQPIRAPFKNGMRISDLIPSREYLITREATKRQNNVVMTDNNSPNNPAQNAGEDVQTIASQIGGLLDEINWDYAVVERVNRADLTVKLIPFNLGNVFTNPDGVDNLQLRPGDTVTIFSQQDVAVPMDKRRVFVRIEGEVKVPGVYQMNAGDTLQSLLVKAGGPTSSAYLFGTAFYRETVRKEQQANLEKAAARLETQLRNEQADAVANARAITGADAQVAVAQRQAQLDLAKQAINRFRQMKPSGRIAFGLTPQERSFAHLPQIKLENGDRLVIPAKPDFVHVFGAVNVEASPLWRPNTRVKDYLQIAGLNAQADTDNIFVMRVDGTVVSSDSLGWFAGGIGGLEIMPGDSIVIPERLDKETRWTKFTQGTREWAQIFANFGLGAAAIKTLRD